MTTSAQATALNDQIQAASQHARAMLTAVADQLGTHPTHVRPSPWLTEHIRALARSIVSGQARGCPHITAAPCIVHAAVWAPGILTCTDCRAALTADPDEDTTCDRCRRRGRPLHTAVTAVGPILLGYGLCQPCATATNLLPRKAPRR
jgi:hypothetical protein